MGTPQLRQLPQQPHLQLPPPPPPPQLRQQQLQPPRLQLLPPQPQQPPLPPPPQPSQQQQPPQPRQHPNAAVCLVEVFSALKSFYESALNVMLQNKSLQ